MGQGVTNRFNDGLVEFDLFAFYDEIRLFTQFLGEISDNTLEFAEDIANWLHPGTHD